ncbi:hypothetical protein KI387_003932, partial [Taxus chinensis]
LATERQREERQLKYNKACEREIEKHHFITESMALRREMAHEGFTSHIEDMEPEHQELPHLGKHDRDPPMDSHRCVLVKTTGAIGVHRNPPGDLALALSFPLSSMTSIQQANLGSRRVG